MNGNRKQKQSENQDEKASCLAYDYVVGTGGIGFGILFELEGDHSLGRNESRLGRLTQSKDYCKQHIILHYVAVLAGRRIPVYAIGCVGNDQIGDKIISEMKNAGINIVGVQRCADASTMYSVCFQYPDRTGGNITTSNSACELVCAESISKFFNDHKNDLTEKGMLLAAPEVPIDARIALLTEGRKRGCFNVAALLSSEIEEFDIKGGLESVDMISINVDEAEAIARYFGSEGELKEINNNCIEFLVSKNENMKIIITNGKESAVTYEHGNTVSVPVLESNAVSTAGAGDSFLAGIMVGLLYELPFQKNICDVYFGQTPLVSAVELGTIIASMKIQSQDTINFDINAVSLKDFATSRNIIFSEEFNKFLWERMI